MTRRGRVSAAARRSLLVTGKRESLTQGSGLLVHDVRGSLHGDGPEATGAGVVWVVEEPQEPKELDVHARLRHRCEDERQGAPLIGRQGIVTHDIDPVVGSGRVNVGGEDWAAKSPEAIAMGTTIRVVAADGIVLEVIRP